MSTYRTIVADPPWDYGTKSWASITHGGTGPRIERDLPYSTMSLRAIKALPVATIAAPDCRLFLWTTNRHLPDAFEVLAAWGFTYTQGLVWRKTGNPSPFAGSGVALQTHEYLIVAKRGKPPVSSQLKSSVIDAPAVVFGHSAKPECFLDFVEQTSPGPYVELFARRQRFGWDTWGDESLSTANLEWECPHCFGTDGDHWEDCPDPAGVGLDAA
jgi:N6-adenosine-specific RNA methylase IME4